MTPHTSYWAMGPRGTHYWALKPGTHYWALGAHPWALGIPAIALALIAAIGVVMMVAARLRRVPG